MSYEKAKKKHKQKQTNPPNLDYSIPYGFVDGAATKNPNVCSTGGILHISNSHKIPFERGFGAGTNNQEEVKSISIPMEIVLVNVTNEILKYMETSNWL